MWHFAFRYEILAWLIFWCSQHALIALIPGKVGASSHAPAFIASLSGWPIPATLSSEFRLQYSARPGGASPRGTPRAPGYLFALLKGYGKLRQCQHELVLNEIRIAQNLSHKSDNFGNCSAD
jgi:hypothetical protein